MDLNRKTEEITALVELCRALATFDLSVGMSDARPAISVRNGLTGRKLWISIDSTRESFVWRREDHDHHSVNDPAGAAERIAAYLKERDDRPGRTP
jgi:hypothetical protein